METLNEKVLKVLDEFGMMHKKAAQAMGITLDTFAKKKSEKVPWHHFNEKNYEDLINFIKEKTANLD